jgi:uncharacterized protein (TIGR02246 family)
VRSTFVQNAVMGQAHPGPKLLLPPTRKASQLLFLSPQRHIPMRISHLSTVLSTMLVACQAAAPRADRVADSSAIQALNDRATAANNTGDIESWVALFENGAIYMPPGSPEVTTVEGLREAARAGFSRYAADIRIVPTELRILGDWAIGRSHVTGSVRPKAGGDSIPIDIKQLVIYRRQNDGSWRISRMMNNSNRE